MRIIDEIKLDFNDVLIIPHRSTLRSRSEVSLDRTFTFKHSQQTWTGVPIIAANMDTVATLSMARELSTHNMITALHKHYTVDELIHFYNNNLTSHVFYSMGIGQADLDKFNTVNHAVNVQRVCVDVANGYSEPFLDFIKQLRTDNPQITIMAGNVVTGEMTEALILAGVDIVKIGIGGGSVCTTRLIAGVGFPQLSAIIECADAAHGLGGLVCGDGGCTTPGDISKAFGGGADFVMLGGMLAGHDECEGEIDGAFVAYRGNSIPAPKVHEQRSDWTYVVTHNGYQYGVPATDLNQLPGVDNMNHPLYRKYKDLFHITIPENPKMKFYGMSSKTAMNKHSGGVAEYRASEGKEVLVPYKGPVDGTIQQILGGIRSTCTYTGARTLKELSKRTTFVRVNQTHNAIFGDSTKQ